MTDRTEIVADERALELALAGYVAQGFMVVNRTGASATLRKPKQFNVPLAILGLLFCGVGLLVYAIIYNSQSDQVVEIRVGGPEPHATFSDDGHWWWDGTRWRPVPPTERMWTSNPESNPRTENPPPPDDP